MNRDEAKKLKEAAEQISSGEEESILAGIQLLSKSHMAEGVDLIGPFLKHPSNTVKMAALNALGELQAPAAVGLLAEVLVIETDQHIRAHTATVLGQIKLRKALPVLANLLKDSNSRVRANAVEAIADIGEPESISLLTPLLDDSNNRVKANVAMALWKFGGLRMVGLLKMMLKSHGDKWHRASAAFALGEVGGIHTIASLIEALEDRAPEVRRNAIRSLGKTGDTEISRQLITFLDDEDPFIRGNTLESLGTVDDEKNLDLILTKLSDERDPFVLGKAKICLEKIAVDKSPAIIGRMKKVFYSETQQLKQMVVEIFEKHGSADVLPDLMNISRSGLSAELRKSAKRAAEAIRNRKTEEQNP